MSHYQASVTVTLKPEILDVQGRTVMEAVHQLARNEVRAVRCGKFFDLKIEASSAGEAKEIAGDIAHKLLANPVIEQFHIDIKEA